MNLSLYCLHSFTHIFCIYPLYMEKLRRSTSLWALTHNKREVLLNHFDALMQASLTERNKKLSTSLVSYTGKKEILKPFRFISSQFQYGVVDVSVVQAFLVKRNRKLLAIWLSLPACWYKITTYPLLFIFLAS